MSEVRIDEDLWGSSFFPEGLLETWLVADGSAVATGQAVAVVRIHDACHDILSPADGRMTRLAAANAVVEPGSVIAQVDA